MTTQEILQECTVEGNVVKLPNITLDKKQYNDVKKSLNKIGGTWVGRKTAGFVFQLDPTELLKEIASGVKRNLKVEYQYFGTPKSMAIEVVELAMITKYDTILEPSVGQGAILREINKVSDCVVDCYEPMPTNIDTLNKSGLCFNLIGDDFLKNDGKKYSKIIANPPFTKNQDITHLRAMYDILEDEGRLVCITSKSWETGKQVKQKDFKTWLEDGDKMVNIIEIPEGSFKESGAMVGGFIIVIDKI